MPYDSPGDVVSTRHLRSGKGFLAPSVFTKAYADNYTLLGSALWFTAETLSVDGFVDGNATNG